MSLRTRLLRSVLVLLALGLAASAIATYAAARADLRERANQQLRAAAEEATRLVGSHASLELPSSAESAPLWRAVADGGGSPSFFQVRTPGGEVVQTVALGTAPTLPSDVAPDAVSSKSPDGERFRGIDVEQEGWRTQNWQLRSSWLPDRSGYLVVGMRTTSATDFAGELMLAQSIVTVVVLGVIAFLGWRSVRRGMRPLEEIATTAGAIGAGDLTRRVSDSDDQPTEVARLATAFNAMLGQLETAFRERAASEDRLRQFVADASHELRTPVATVRAYAELFRRGAAGRPDDLAMVLRRIESETERMGLLVDELLLLARLDQGRPLDRVPVDLAELASDAVAAALAVGPEHPLSLEAEGITVVGDPARLRQAVDNLLANVRQHTPPGTSASVRVARSAGAAIVEVSDRGPGLATDALDRVFERFYRADAARSRDNGGVGLGLAIVAAVASAHGGAASVYARPRGGTTFRLRLPAS